MFVAADDESQCNFEENMGMVFDAKCRDLIILLCSFEIDSSNLREEGAISVEIKFLSNRIVIDRTQMRKTVKKESEMKVMLTNGM